ncbi:MAG TPA: ATP-grasp domain-containing protein [Bacteroidia bacterium]|nr:ATP-grasp domain-containing protein [Bacteroidia bacterium]
MKTLLVPSKSDQERDRVVQAWKSAGGRVERIEKFWKKPALMADEMVAIYGNDTFALVLAQILDLNLLSPDDALIAQISDAWTKRSVLQQPLGALSDADFPLFVKPVMPKQFRAAVYQTREALQAATHDLPAMTPTLTSNKVDIESEARFFILGGKVQAAAIYEGEGSLAAAESMVQTFARDHLEDLPYTYVVDIAFNALLCWFVLEFNAVWGAGLNGCDPGKVVACIAAATCKP